MDSFTTFINNVVQLHVGGYVISISTKAVKSYTDKTAFVDTYMNELKGIKNEEDLRKALDFTYCATHDVPETFYHEDSELDDAIIDDASTKKRKRKTSKKE